MTTATTNIPLINISQQNVIGKCDLKCDYNFKYTNSNSIATNLGIYIQISYEQSGIPPVTYNNVKYNVDYIIITQPSVHNFNGSQAVAEILIIHSPLKGGKQLIVSIPFTTSGDSTTASNILSEIITLVTSNAPNSGEKVNLNSSDFSLQNIIPKKPFYNYSGESYNYIVFDITNAIPISSSVLNNLNTILQPISNIDAAVISQSSTQNISLFYNSKGPNTNNQEDEIYISCNPTGNSEKEETVTFQKAKNETVSLDFSKIMSNQYFIYFMYALIFIIILMLVSILIGAFTSNSIKMPSFVNKIYGNSKNSASS